MAITGADWSAANDPFILSLSHLWASTVGMTESINLVSSSGFLNGISDDPEIQEIYFSKDTDSSVLFSITAVETEVFSFFVYRNEWPLYDENVSGSYNPIATYNIVQPDTKDCLLVHKGKISGGAYKHSLFAYSAYAWEGRDPAQIIFSWLAHHAKNGTSLKGYIDQASFQAASDYYDDNKLPLVVYREAGSLISDQIKKVMKCTSDFLAIRPSAVDGKVTLHLLTRRSGLLQRSTAISLDGRSVKSYLIRPTDRYTVDEVIVTYGNTIQQNWIPLATTDLYKSVSYVGDSINVSRQKVRGADYRRSINIEAKYVSARQDVLGHIDIQFWKDDQKEIEIDFADWTHFNFEVGDIVPGSGGGLAAGEKYLCTEKRLDLDTLLASARFLQIHGIEGKIPRHADPLYGVLSLRPNSLGDHYDGAMSIPGTIMERSRERSRDRWWDESGNYFNAVEHIRGTPPAPPQLALDVRQGWPSVYSNTFDGLEFADDNGSGYNKIGTAGTRNYTFYYVGNLTGSYPASSAYLLDMNGADHLIFSISSSAAYGAYQFYDGTWRGSKPFSPGWQILVFVLSSTGSTIRKNGVDLETGLAYTMRQIDNTGTFGLTCDAGGTFANAYGDHCEFHLFSTAHNSTTVAAIEAHLAEKYGISI